jgi:hypothetical protein
MKLKLILPIVAIVVGLLLISPLFEGYQFERGKSTVSVEFQPTYHSRWYEPREPVTIGGKLIYNLDNALGEFPLDGEINVWLDQSLVAKLPTPGGEYLCKIGAPNEGGGHLITVEYQGETLQQGDRFIQISGCSRSEIFYVRFP